MQSRYTNIKRNTWRALALFLATVFTVSSSFAEIGQEERDLPIFDKPLSRIYKINEQAGFFDIKEIEIKRLAVTTVDISALNLSDESRNCGRDNTLKAYDDDGQPSGQPSNEPANQPAPQPQKPSDGFSIPPTGIVEIDAIVNIGMKVWDLIQANKPVVNVQTMLAHGLPKGVSCWEDLTNWKRPRSETYSISYKNGFGFEVVTFNFRLVYAYGGQLVDVGQYLSNVTIQVADLNVMWGFQFDAVVDVPMVLNLGSKDAPVAGMQMNIQWKINGLNHLQKSVGFFVSGDGAPTDLL